MTKRGAQREATWTARLNAAKQWKQTMGRFAKSNKKDKEETNPYVWSNSCFPGGRNYTEGRWERLNEAFGEGWEKECFPYLATNVRLQPGNKIGFLRRNMTRWDAILDEVMEFMRVNGRFPKCRGDKNEVRLYYWLRRNADTTSDYWTRERHGKLIDALGERWWSECFPKSMYPC